MDTNALAQANRFSVVLGDPQIRDLGRWQKCDGLQVTFDNLKVEEGGTYDHEIYLPKQIKYKDIVLTRAVDPKDTPKVRQWLSKQALDYKGDTLTISVYDHSLATPTVSWTLRNARPKDWKCATLDAAGSKVLVETLTFIHEGFLDT